MGWCGIVVGGCGVVVEWLWCGYGVVVAGFGVRSLAESSVEFGGEP